MHIILCTMRVPFKPIQLKRDRLDITGQKRALFSTCCVWGLSFLVDLVAKSIVQLCDSFLVHI